MAVELNARGRGPDQVLTFRTNIAEHVTAGRDHPLRVALDPETAEPAPYIHVRDGLEALIARAVFDDLVEVGVEDPDSGVLGVWSGGVLFPFGPVGDGA